MNQLTSRIVPLAALALTGCTTLIGPGSQPPTTPEANFFAPAHYADAAFETGANALTLSAQIDESGRRFLAKYMRRVDLSYAAYVGWLTSGRASVDTTYDSVGLATTGAAAISTVTSVKTGLAAIATFAQGQKSAIDKNYYQNKVVFTLINVMETSRSDVRNRIREGLKANSYTMHDALFDLEAYYKVGTIDVALTTTSVAASPASPEQPPTPGTAASAPGGAASGVAPTPAPSEKASTKPRFRSANLY